MGMAQNQRRIALSAAAVLWSGVGGAAQADTKRVEAGDLLLNACIPAVAMAKPVKDLLPAGFDTLDGKAAGALGFSGGGWSYGPPGPDRVVIGIRGERCLAMGFKGSNPAAAVTALEASARTAHVALSMTSDGSGAGPATHQRDYLVRAEGALPVLLSIRYPEKGGAFMGVVRPMLERVAPPLIAR